MSGIDDIPYMVEHGTKEEYLLFIDSATRDKLSYKTPSQYQVNFDVPFYNVFGVDVLDTSIPRTQYLVDFNNNTMAFNIDDEGWSRFEVDPGDYNISQLTETMQVGLVNNSKPIYITTVSSPGDVKGQLKFYSNYPFQLNMTMSSIREVIGFANPIIQSDSSYYDYPVGYTEGDDDVFVANVDTGNVNYVTSFSGPTPVTNSLPITSTSVSQLFNAVLSGNVVQVDAQFAQIGTPTSNNVQFSIFDGSNTSSIMATGNLNVLIDTFLTPSMCQADQIQQYQTLVIDRPYYLSFTTQNTDTGNTWGIYYAQPNTPQTGVPGIYTGGSNTPYSDYSQQLCCSVLQGGEQYTLVAPGLYNLTGVRYILIRCQEIEDHLYNSQAFTNNYNMGLTKVQMGNFGYGDNRYDFTNYTSRTFHPIAKLKKMTLRFELADGSLYDFKGVDHTLTFKLRYYASNQKTSQQYILNPSYNPNLREWNKQKADEQKRLQWEREKQHYRGKIERKN